VPRDVAAQALEFALLENAQQLHLDVRRHVADFVQEHRPRIGLLELARLGSRGAGEGALLVAEELAFHQVFREGGAVDLHQRPVAARRVEMNGARDQVLPYPAFAGQQHGGARGGDALDGGEDFLHVLASSDDAARRSAVAFRIYNLIRYHCGCFRF
jgi:hypothetical protein